jgi:hypothetical protein
MNPRAQEDIALMREAVQSMAVSLEKIAGADYAPSELAQAALRGTVLAHLAAEAKSDDQLERELIRDIRNQLVHLNGRLSPSSRDHIFFEDVLDAWDLFEEEVGTAEGGEREILS